MSSKRSRVDPKYKTKYRVANWPEYDRSLIRRGDVTLWLTPAAVASWNARPSGRRGGQPKYSDLAIETTLTLRLVFHLSLRQAEGFLGSVFHLMGIDLETPDHTTLSRRGRQLHQESDCHSAAMSGPRQDCSSRGQGRPTAVEEGVRLPPASTGRERLLQVQVDHQRQAPSTWSESPSRRGTTRLQRPQPADRDRSANLNRHRKLNPTDSGTSRPCSRIMHQRRREPSEHCTASASSSRRGRPGLMLGHRAEQRSRPRALF